jgi:hypothetical protein
MIATCCCLASGSSASAAAPTWGNAEVIPGPGGTVTTVDAVSCASPGNCGAGGEYSGGEAFVASETGGVWGSAEELPGSATLNTGGLALVDAISCTAPGDCSAAGTYASGNINNGEALTATETNGTWGDAQEVAGALNAGESGQAFTVSCASAGNCSAGGIYLDNAGDYQAFIVSQENGTWGTAEEVPGTAALNAGGNAAVESVSCPSAGNCVAVGNYSDTPGSGEDQAFLLTETDGAWGSAGAIPSLASLSSDGTSYVTSVSCPSAGNCGAVGTYTDGNTGIDQAFIVGESGGTWGNAQLVPGVAGINVAGGNSAAGGISCPSAGNCSVTGTYANDTEAFVATQANGAWGTAQTMPGMDALDVGDYIVINTMSCGAAGDCTVGGYYSSSTTVEDDRAPFLDDETNGTWGTAQEVPGVPGTETNGQVYGVSCASADSCSAGGYYTSGGFVTDKTTVQSTSTAITLSAPTVTYGDEQTERVTVTVSAGSAGTPAGSVTVSSGSRTVCTATLASGTASCTVPATALAPGSVQLTASYAGDPDFGSSVSSASSLAVSAASSTTSLAAGAASVPYGHEQAETISVGVAPQFSGTPGGQVAIASGSRTVCTAALASGSASCTVPATAFAPGQVQLTASYAGDADFGPSVSAARQFAVTRAASKADLKLSAARITYGHEHSERLSVTVSPQYGGTPAGTVTVRSGRTVVCRVRLSGGKGTCLLSARALRPGSHRLVASYPGSAYFGGSSSPARTVTVAK